MSEISEKIKIQKEYLGDLFIGITPEELSVFDSLFSRNIKTGYFLGENCYLKKLAVYFLLSKGKWLEYQYLTSSEVLACYLSKEVPDYSDGKRFHLDLSTPIIILHHLKFSMTNSALEPLMCQYVSERRNRGLITIVLAEDNLINLKDSFREMNLYVHPYKIESHFVGK